MPRRPHCRGADNRSQRASDAEADARAGGGREFLRNQRAFAHDRRWNSAFGGSARLPWRHSPWRRTGANSLIGWRASRGDGRKANTPNHREGWCARHPSTGSGCPEPVEGQDSNLWPSAPEAGPHPGPLRADPARGYNECARAGCPTSRRSDHARESDVTTSQPVPTLALNQVRAAIRGRPPQRTGSEPTASWAPWPSAPRPSSARG